MYDTQITDEQRKAFSELIKEAQRNYESKFDSHLRSLKEEIVPKLEAKSKVKQLMDDIRNWRGKAADAADGLRRLGFRVVDDGMISIDYDIDTHARRQLEERLRDAYKDHEETMASFRKSVFDVWSAKTPDEAREIVREVMR